MTEGYEEVLGLVAKINNRSRKGESVGDNGCGV
jgi:hypothetical protein